MEFQRVRETYRRIRYNRQRKPWRSVRFIHALRGGKNYVPRLCLCGMIGLEVMVIGVREPELFLEAGRLFEAGWEHSRTAESEPAADIEPYPSDRSDSGITIDLKEGKVEFWRTDQSVRSGAEENE